MSGETHDPSAEVNDEPHGPESEHDWSRFDPHEADRRARRAERDARDAEREARRGERDARRADRDATRAQFHGAGVHLGGGVGMPFGFNAAEFTKSFMKDFAEGMTGDSYGETINAEFPFEHMPRLRVRNISGETTIRVGEAGKIAVVARKHVVASSEDRAKRLLQNLEIRMEQRGDELVIEPHLYEQERGWVDLFRGKRFRVDLEIAVPAECAIDAQTVSGDLSVAGVRGPLEAQSVSGDVTIEDAQGPLRFKTVSGDVSCRRYVGHADGNTVSGDVTADAVRLRSLQLQTVSGEIMLRGVLEAAREHRIRSISGDVDLGLVEPDLTVEFRSASGDLESEIAGTVSRVGRKEFDVTLGGGRGRALVRTVSGDLTIQAAEVDVPGEPSTDEPLRASEAAEPAAPDAAGAGGERTEPMAPPADAQVRAVLERLAKGELNVDDAAAALDAARKGQ